MIVRTGGAGILRPYGEKASGVKPMLQEDKLLAHDTTDPEDRRKEIRNNAEQKLKQLGPAQ